MSENNANPPNLAKLGISPTLLMRICSILFFGLMIGHMYGYPWASSYLPQEVQLVGLMKTTDFVFAGEHQTYWGLYYGWGILIGVLLLMTAIILWLVSDLAQLAPRRVAIITGVVSLVSLIGCCISFRFFYIPPAVCFAVLAVVLLAATVQLLKKEN
jgi:hypothetical protein